MVAFETIDDISAVAAKVFAALKRFPSSWGGDEARLVHFGTISAGSVSAFMDNFA